MQWLWVSVDPGPKSDFGLIRRPCVFVVPCFQHGNISTSIGEIAMKFWAYVHDTNYFWLSLEFFLSNRLKCLELNVTKCWMDIHGSQMMYPKNCEFLEKLFFSSFVYLLTLSL